MEQTENIQGSVTPPVEEPEAPRRDPHVLDDDFCQRCIKAYYSIVNEDDVFDMTTDLLATTHAYMTALDESKGVNHKQGKLRFSSNFTSRELMTATKEDSEETLNSKVGMLLVAMINKYIDTHFIMENMSAATAENIRRSMKVLYITIICGGYTGILDQLHTPDYMKGYVEACMKAMKANIESIITEWSSYLREHESAELAEISETVGLDLFQGSKAIDTFKKYFSQYIPTMNDYDATYDLYLKLRNRFSSNVLKINRKEIYQYFDISDKQFLNNRKDYFLPEFQSMFLGTEYEEPLKLLILGE